MFVYKSIQFKWHPEDIRKQKKKKFIKIQLFYLFAIAILVEVWSSK